ncbi:hypothetical protein Dsin_030428 [Dipteronia sinensis]|uniref:Uncharacterized protein n=1 Tax=Dipteronia sinensis TaxID=43782 RepID=A0AAD9ZJM3_9ROSI|nr:hypothetical protein Dsin_030428 [Dipteronia sinensis]
MRELLFYERVGHSRRLKTCRDRLADKTSRLTIEKTWHSNPVSGWLVRSRKPCLLQDILLVWTRKKSNELSLFSTIDIKLLVPQNLDILVYITQESEPPLMSRVLVNEKEK